MQLRRHLWLMWSILGLSLSACAGGSGSSGFDNFPGSENAAIQTALDDQRCVSFHALNICPADTTGVLPSPTPSASPTNVVLIPTPLSTATTTPLGRATVTEPASASPTPTPTPSTPRVDTGINDGAIPCTPSASSSECVLVVPFAPDGFPPAAVFRVAVRTVDPPGAWNVGPDLMPSNPSTAPVFDAPVAVVEPAKAPDVSQRVQVAVLAFLKPPVGVPVSVENLTDSGADYAFVTTDLTLQTPAPAGDPNVACAQSP